MSTLQVMWGNTRKVPNGSKSAEPPVPQQILVFWKDAMNRYRESLVDVCYPNRGVTPGELWRDSLIRWSVHQNKTKTNIHVTCKVKGNALKMLFFLLYLHIKTQHYRNTRGKLLFSFCKLIYSMSGYLITILVLVLICSQTILGYHLKIKQISN